MRPGRGRIAGAHYIVIAHTFRNILVRVPGIIVLIKCWRLGQYKLCWALMHVKWTSAAARARCPCVCKTGQEGHACRVSQWTTATEHR